MKPVSFSDRILGHGLGVGLAASAACFSVFAWMTQPVSWLVPLFALLLCKAAVSARRRVSAFASWKRSWDQMSGEQPRQDAAKRARRRWFNGVLGPVAWLALFAWLSVHASEPTLTVEYECGCVLFLVLSLVGLWAAGAALLRFAGRIRRRAVASGVKRAQTFIVAVCPRRPLRSPTPEQCIATLPEYCRVLLLARGTAVPPPNGNAQRSASQAL